MFLAVHYVNKAFLLGLCSPSGPAAVLSPPERAAGQKRDFSVPRQLQDAITCNGRNGVKGINVPCSLSFLFLVITGRDLLITQGGCRPAPTSSPASSHSERDSRAGSEGAQTQAKPACCKKMGGCGLLRGRIAGTSQIAQHK